MELDEIEELMKEDGMLQNLPWAIPVPNSAVSRPPARLDADLFYDLAWSQGGDLLEIRQADLNVEGSTLAMHGSIDISGPLTRVL